AYAQSLYPPESNFLLDVATLEAPEVTFYVARLVGAGAAVGIGARGAARRPRPRGGQRRPRPRPARLVDGREGAGCRARPWRAQAHVRRPLCPWPGRCGGAARTRRGACGDPR